MSAFTVARTTLLRASRRPSTYAIAALSFLPPLVGALAGATGHSAIETGGPVAIGLVAPLMVPALVAGSVGEGFENRTVVYWFTRPFPRAQVLLGEALGYGALTMGAMMLSGMLLAAANALTGTADVASLARIPLGLALLAVALTGFSVAVGALVPKHPVLTALSVLLLTEGALPRVWAKFSYTSMGYHSGVLTGLPSVEAGATGDASLRAPSPFVSLAVLVAFGLLPIIVAALQVEDRDLA
jgi:ABC-type transport system involved in multi-copper enzyme maturation permease subunit